MMNNLKSVMKLNLNDYLNPEKKEQFLIDLLFSMKEHGFVIFDNHMISHELLDNAYRIQKQLFELPLERKMELKGEFGQRGYTPFKTEHAKGNKNLDLKEFWHIGRENIYTKNIWPEESELPEFKEIFLKIFNELDNAGNIILDALSEGFKLNKTYFRDMASNGNSIMRLLHYPPLNENEDKNCIRAAAHTDINLITLLVSGTTSGLELLDNEKKWIPVECDKNSLIVNTGDVLNRMTNYIFRSTVHRVINPKNEENVSRYSMPFFVHPKDETLLNEIPIFKGMGKKPKLITAGEYLHQRLKEIGLKK